jgi:hypothetical protein
MVLQTTEIKFVNAPVPVEKANGQRETKLIEVDRPQTVQQLPDVAKEKAPWNRMILGTNYRGPLLPERGSRDRERALYEYYWNDYNTAFRSAIAGLIKRVQSTPWELTGPDDYVEYFQFVLQQADFGRGWETFIAKLVTDYSRYDGGGFIELIGGGEPLQPLYGPVTGLSVLDSRRCLPTGDPAYPALYYDIYGAMHILHHTRVVRFVDMLDPSEYAYGYGDCALSRSISAVVRDIFMNRYIEQRLDDNPPAGIMLFRNVNEKQFIAAQEQLKQQKNTDTGGWGDILRFYGLQPDFPVEVESIPFQFPPEKFDLQTYKQINMRELALGIGLDIQDIWELTSGNLGTATQSEILHQKSKGKALGRILKGLERVINLTLPPSVEFEFQYRDPDEDVQIAQKDTIVIQNATMALQAGGITKEEYRQYLANNVESIREVATDQSGEIIRLDDQDVKAPGQLQPAKAPERATGEPTEESTSGATRMDTETKEYNATVNSFKDSFRRILDSAAVFPTGQFSIEMALRGQLQQAGEQIWLDGLQDGGIENPRIDNEATVAISAWRAQQNQFITQFAKRVAEGTLTAQQGERRAELWVNKSLRNLYHLALGAADNAMMYLWVMNPIKEHCDTCRRMNGQIHSMKEYLKTGIVPQSESLDCNGYQCGCQLVKVPGQKARGRIPTQGRSGLRGLFGAIGRFFGRLLGG